MSRSNNLKLFAKNITKITFFSSCFGATAGASGSAIFYRHHFSLTQIAMTGACGAVGNPLVSLAVVTVLYPFYKLYLAPNEDFPIINKIKSDAFIKYFPIIFCLAGITLGRALLEPRSISKEDTPYIGLIGMLFNVIAVTLFYLGKLCYLKLKNNVNEQTPLLSQNQQGLSRSL